MRGQILEQSNDKFRQIFEKSPIGILFYDSEGKLTDANQSALQIAAVSHLEDIKGTNLFDNYYIESHKEKLLKKGFIRFESPIDLDKIKEMGFFTPIRGGIIYVDYTISITDFGFLAQIQDITEFKNGEIALRNSEERYKQLFNSMTESFQVFELIYNFEGKPIDYRYLEANSALEQLVGLSREEIIGKSVKELFGVVEDYWLEILDNVVKSGKATHYADYGRALDKYYEIYAWKIGGNKVGVIASDITERKKAEGQIQKLLASVREEKDKLSSLINSIPDEIWFADAQRNLELVNPSVVRGFGDGLQGKEVEEIVGNSEVYRPDGTPRPVEEAPPLRALKGEIVRNQGEIVRIPATGELRHRQVNSAPLKDTNGNVIGSISTVRDITELKEAEKAIIESLASKSKILDALKESEERFKSLSETSPVGVGVSSADGKIIYTNPSYDSILGYNSGELIGRKSTDLYWNPEERKSWFSALKDNGLVRDFEVKLKKKDGNQIWISINTSPISFGGNKAVMGTIQDISDRKKAEKELRESEELYRTIFENSDDAFELLEVLFDKDNSPYDWIFLDVNDAFEHQTGLKKKNVLGKRAKEVIPGIEDYWITALGKVAKTGKSEHIEDYNQDTNRWYDDYIFKYKENQVGVLFRDITERKKSEGELKKILGELKRSNEELEQFAYVSSHDLQEPLRTIASFTQLLERRYKGKFDSDADEFMDYIVEAAVRMKEQIEGLLEYSRVATKGKEFQPANLNEILNQTIQTLHTSIEESNAKINVDELPTVIGDANQLQRIFQNLISNAIKFRKQEEPLKINIYANKNIYSNEYVFSIEDNGIGIEEQYSERIFTIFQRLHTREEYKGTGIGLSIVKRIIERHGGRVWVESEPGIGSTFYFALPVDEAETH